MAIGPNLLVSENEKVSAAGFQIFLAWPDTRGPSNALESP
jgi:hypothetical protein